jgi:hypothetical protein
MAEPDPLIGATIGGVQLLEKLGSGGMGSVYLGDQTGMGRKVAIKILPDHLSNNAEYISRFRREAVTAGRLEHPNLVKVYDVGHEGGRYFIVMENVEGESLQRILDAVGPLPPRDAAKVTLGVLRGLHHAHTAGVVHRDIKPDNIIVAAGNEPKILDFGLAVVGDGRNRLTGTGSVLGTPYYISPEQARGKAAEPRSDIYSTGIMLYCLLTGRVPFSGQDPLAVLHMHLHETPVSPINLNPKIPQALNDIVLKMLAKRPADRHPTAEAAARDIQGFLDGKLIAVGRPAVRVVRRKGVPAGLIAGAVLGIAFVVVLVKMSGDSPAPPPPPTPTTLAPPPDPDLADVRKATQDLLAQVTKEGPADFAVYPAALQELEKVAAKYANRRDLVLVVDAARKSVREAAERHAKSAEEAIRPRILQARTQNDAYAVRSILREFPKALLEISDTGRRIARETRDNDLWVQHHIELDLKSIPGLLASDEFEEARTRLDRLGNVVPTEQRAQVAALRSGVETAEAERRLQLIPRLNAEVGELEKQIATLMDKRQVEAAWDGMIAFIEVRPQKKLSTALLRPGPVPTATLREIAPATAVEDQLEQLLLRLEADPPENDEELPGLRLRTLFEDVLRWEWIVRRADKGLQRLVGSEVSIESFGGLKGKVVAGKPPTIDTGNGTPQPLIVSQLAPRDIAGFAAAAAVGPDAPFETVFKVPEHRRLCLAIAIAYRYSPCIDRFGAAQRWIEQAKAHGIRIPAWRLQDLEEAARLEREQLAREYLRKALEHAAAGRFDPAHEELDRVAKELAGRDHFTTLEPIIRDHHARFLLAEAEQEAKASRWARALAAARRLRSGHEGYERERTEAVYSKALLNAGSWSTWPTTPFTAASKHWTWDGKASGTRPPARAEGGQILLMDVGGFRPLYLERTKTAGVTGIRTQMRLNQRQQTFEVGLFFDAKEAGGDLRRFLIHSTGRAEITSRREDRFAVDDSCEVKGPIAAKEWYEAAIVTDGTETVFYFGPKGAPLPLLTLTGGLDPKGAIGLWANADTTFAEIQVRDVKP